MRTLNSEISKVCYIKNNPDHEFAIVYGYTNLFRNRFIRTTINELTELYDSSIFFEEVMTITYVRSITGKVYTAFVLNRDK